MLYLSRAYESERVLKGKKETNWLEPSPLRLCRQAKRTPNSPAAFAQIGHRHLLEMLGERFDRSFIAAACGAAACSAAACSAAARCTCPR